MARSRPLSAADSISNWGLREPALHFFILYRHMPRMCAHSGIHEVRVLSPERPEDEQFPSLSELFGFVEAAPSGAATLRRKRRHTRRGQPGRSRTRLRCRDRPSLLDRCDALELLPARRLVGAPAAYLRQLPAALAGSTCPRPVRGCRRGHQLRNRRGLKSAKPKDHYS